MNANPLEHLKSNLSCLTPSQVKVADYILKNPIDVAFFTLEKLAISAGTSTTTIIRLVSVLGYSGYSEFQENLQTLLKTHSSPHIRLKSSLSLLPNEDSGGLWQQCIDNQISALQNIHEQISPADLDKCVEVMLHAEHLYFSSSRGGRPVVRFLTDSFNRLLGKGELLDVDGIDWSSLVQSVGKNDVFLAVSFPRYTKRVVQMLNILRSSPEQPPFIISITDSYTSPLAGFSDIVIPCSITSQSFYNSPIAAMAVADYLITAASMADPSSVEARLKKINNITSELEYYVI